MIYVFDLDGTLINSFDRHVKVLKNSMEICGIDFNIDEREYINYKKEGKNNKAYLKNILYLDDDSILRVTKKWEELIEQRPYTLLDCLYFDVMQVLDILSNKHDIYYLTARKEAVGLLQDLDRLGIAAYSKNTIIVNPKNALREKTEELYKLKSSNEAIVMIGDTEVDYEAASKNNCNVYIVNRGFRSLEYWNRLGVTTYENLLKLL